MSNKLFASILAATLSLASAASFAAPAENQARDQATPAKVQTEDGKTRYWSHPRLGLVKVDAAGRMLDGHALPQMTLRDQGRPPGIRRPAPLEPLVRRPGSLPGAAWHASQPPRSHPQLPQPAWQPDMAPVRSMCGAPQSGRTTGTRRGSIVVLTSPK
ncbi:hypothetical protein [Variovorax gossypii]